jgi:hypothetical protein
MLNHLCRNDSRGIAGGISTGSALIGFRMRWR